MVRKGAGYDSISGIIITLWGFLWILFIYTGVFFSEFYGLFLNLVILGFGVILIISGLFLILKDSSYRRQNKIQVRWTYILKKWIGLDNYLLKPKKTDEIMIINNDSQESVIKHPRPDIISSLIDLQSSERLEDIHLTPDQFEEYRIEKNNNQVIPDEIITFQNNIINKAKLLDFHQYEVILWSIWFFKQTKRFQKLEISTDSYLKVLNHYSDFLDNKINS
ncbi:MAG: hypothetical protein ACFE9L_21870 [Candidatus Hodarchaeota archaeon]